MARGRSPTYTSPKSSLSPEDSRSPSCPRHPNSGWLLASGLHGLSASRYSHTSPPRTASPYSLSNDYDILFELPQDVEWHRFEVQVGVADEAAGTWPLGSHAKFLVIDEDLQLVLWESSDSLEPWAPVELCSLLFGAGQDSSSGEAGPMPFISEPSLPTPPRQICLRVQCAAAPEGALWIEPALTVLKPSPAVLGVRLLTQPCRAGSGGAGDDDAHHTEDASSGMIHYVRSSGYVSSASVLRPTLLLWDEVLASEMVFEILPYLQCREAARLLNARHLDSNTQQFMWHFVFAYNFRPAYLRHFLRPFQGHQRPPALLAFAAASTALRGGATAGRHGATGTVATAAAPTPASATSPRTAVASAGAVGVRPGLPALVRHDYEPGVFLASLPPSMGSWAAQGRAAPRTASAAALAAAATSGTATAASMGMVPLWALEVFDWRQVCRKFYMAQLQNVSVNFQLHNCATPAGFMKDSGDVFPALREARASTGTATVGVNAGAPAGGPHPPQGVVSGTLRYGWNQQLGADHFLSRPSAVVAHRSPLGVAGVPPNVATVRGTAGPEPLARTPMASERDSSVVLPLPLGQIRPQWMLLVDPGHYLVVVTVGDRNVGFAAHLEVGGTPLFNGEWIEAGNFKSRCMLCVASRGAITVGPYWPRAGGRDREEPSLSDPLAAMPLLESPQPVLTASGCGGVRHHSLSPPSGESPRERSPPRQLSPRSGGAGLVAGVTSPKSLRNDALAKGTRLVSLRVMSACLAREVERERRPLLQDLNQKVAEAKARVESLKQALLQAVAQHFIDGAAMPTDARGAATMERELCRAHAKLAELHVQKAMKLFSMVAMYKRVTHPYIYLNGEMCSAPPTEPDLDRPNI